MCHADFNCFCDSSPRRASPSVDDTWKEEEIEVHTSGSKAPSSISTGHPGPFEEDRVRSGLQLNYPGASPCSAGKLQSFKRQLFQKPAMITGGMALNTNSTQNPSPSASEATQDNPSLDSAPLGQLLQQPGNDYIDQCPVNPRGGRQRDRPDLEYVVTQQTELLAAMLERLNQGQAAALPPGAPAEPQPDPNFDWARLALPSETNSPVPGDGTMQRMATSLFARIPSLNGRDQHEARFVLQVISTRPDLPDADRRWANQRLNVYCIVASLGWPVATAACAASTMNTDYFLPPGTVIPQQNYNQQGNRRQRDQQQQQPAQPAPAPAPARAGGQGGGQGGRRNRRGRGRGNNPA